MKTSRYLTGLLGLLFLGLVGCSRPAPTPETHVASQSESKPTTETKLTNKTGDLCASSSKEDWRACDGHQVMLQVYDPSDGVSQHPMMNRPTLDENAPEIIQSYFNVDEGTQLVVLSTEKPGACKGKMQITGKLERIEMGGSVGKSTYKGWAVHNTQFQCLP